MEKRKLGPTALEVSVIGFGGIPVQRVSENEVKSLLLAALEEGINFIDTARGYNESESLLGGAMKAIGREKFILATKSMARDYEGILKEVETSLKNLQTDYIDLFQFHNVREEAAFKEVMGENGALKAIKELQVKGIIKEIGITSHSIEILEKAIETDEFVSIQYPYNPAELQGEALFEKAHQKNIGVIIMKPLAGGAISKGELCMRFILENPHVTTVIPGMDSIEQVRENAIAGKDFRPLSTAERQALDDELASLDHHFCRRCGYCAPCSVGMDISFQFILEGYYSRYNLQDWSKGRYGDLLVNAGDCIQCGDCEPRCPYDLPIMDMLVNVNNILG